jgi:hypothetical protein
MTCQCQCNVQIFLYKLQLGQTYSETLNDLSAQDQVSLLLWSCATACGEIDARSQPDNMPDRSRSRAPSCAGECWKVVAVVGKTTAGPAQKPKNIRIILDEIATCRLHRKSRQSIL